MDTSPHPATLPGQRLYAVGDIHGRVDLLARLTDMIAADSLKHNNPLKEIIFLGDYVDRGVDSRGVIDYLIGRLPLGFMLTFLRGNHEDVMLRFLDGDFGQAEGWLQFGGAATLMSYGINPYGKGNNESFDALHEALMAKIPQAHRKFLASTALNCTRGGYYFVHAGVRPNVPLSQQAEKDKLWIRQDFLYSEADHGKMIVHGHTVTPEPEIRNNRIGIDTGAYATGHLTCLVLDGTERHFLST